ncbi:hypothetical protein CBI38_29120 [Rhodococcus oxybenzonivorans]|uniref:Uncharacterized protein n=1 Tax=Rhodococcus oxybenzonivorans TaxID=1990687 RepID=A0A2S2C2A6_9NOCA|nr:hypothetical protein [Rhodococcus oxybenzonivorans]AWK75015.1 hypothetical protein CBI38_29120 [Rhodococcus oxybenzonivorans]
MPDSVTVRAVAGDLWVITPGDAPSVLDDDPGIDVAVLEVAGGHLSWSVLTEPAPPTAVIDDVTSAQDWVWALYGEAVALALAEPAVALAPAEPGGSVHEVEYRPARPRLAANVRRLAFALWAARWWPASTIDAIPALDDALLDRDIAGLVDDCESVVAGADAVLMAVPPRSAGNSARAEDYALAAGTATAVRAGTLVLARGTGGTDWRRCPPGLIDASERAVSWEVQRVAGTTSVRVAVVGAPNLAGAVATHLRPRATVAGADPVHTADVELHLIGDTWVGDTDAPPGSEQGVTVNVYLPGFGGNLHPALGGRDVRDRIRDLARQRLQRAAAPDSDDDSDVPLLAEIDAAASESDF